MLYHATFDNACVCCAMPHLTASLNVIAEPTYFVPQLLQSSKWIVLFTLQFKFPVTK